MLREAPQGLVVSVEGPGGSCTLTKNATKAAVSRRAASALRRFWYGATGGGGQSAAATLPVLFEPDPEDIPFLELLAALPAENPKFHFIATMTAMAKSRREWTGETGVIDREMLLRHFPDQSGPFTTSQVLLRWLPPMRKMLASAGVDEDDIRTEEFSGY